MLGKLSACANSRYLALFSNGNEAISHYAIHHSQSWDGRSVRAHSSIDTGWLVWTSTFPCTHGLSLMKLSTSGAKGRLQCESDCIDDRQKYLGYQKIGFPNMHDQLFSVIHH